MNRLRGATIRVLYFLLFVFFAREFISFVEIDGCLDAGGAVDKALMQCVTDGEKPWAMVAVRPYIAWVVGLGIPALLVWSIAWFFGRLRAQNRAGSA